MIPDPHILAAILADVSTTEIMPRFRNLATADIREKSAGDLVTIADIESEKRLETALGALIPDCRIVGEEAAANNPDVLAALGDKAPVWIIDPVDGTTNFATGIPCFAIIIALAVSGDTKAGWIYDPINETMVWAKKGGGAWMYEREQGTRLKISTDLTLGECAGSLGRGPKRRLERLLDAGNAVAPTDITRYGCVGIEYTDLARSRLGFARYGGHLKPWDHAAGVLIHAEAGGFSAVGGNATPYRPTPDTPSQTLTLAASKAHWRELTEMLAD